MTNTSFEVTRAIVLRVGGPIDRDAVAQLRRILTDLIDDHDVTDLVIDLTHATEVGAQTTDVLDWAQHRLTEAGGQLELRLPSAPTEALVEISADVPTFIPLTDRNQAV